MGTRYEYGYNGSVCSIQTVVFTVRKPASPATVKVDTDTDTEDENHAGVVSITLLLRYYYIYLRVCYAYGMVW